MAEVKLLRQALFALPAFSAELPKYKTLRAEVMAICQNAAQSQTHLPSVDIVTEQSANNACTWLLNRLEQLSQECLKAYYGVNDISTKLERARFKAETVSKPTQPQSDTEGWQLVFVMNHTNQACELEIINPLPIRLEGSNIFSQHCSISAGQFYLFPACTPYQFTRLSEDLPISYLHVSIGIKTPAII